MEMGTTTAAAVTAPHTLIWIVVETTEVLYHIMNTCT
jgi:hypothetical protein